MLTGRKLSATSLGKPPTIPNEPTRKPSYEHRIPAWLEQEENIETVQPGDDAQSNKITNVTEGNSNELGGEERRTELTPSDGSTVNEEVEKVNEPTVTEPNDILNNNHPTSSNLCIRRDSNSIGSATSLNSRGQDNAISKSPIPSIDGDTRSISTCCSQPDSLGSQSSEKKRTFFNKYVKRVKNLIKK